DNNQYFQIERSADGINWKSLQTIEGAGVRSTSIRKYSSVDKEPLYGFNYYRIRQVNTDGTFSHSEVRKVNNSLTTNISVFPNPATDFAIVNGLDKNRSNMIHLLDVTGKLISEHFIKDSQYRFNLSKLQPGVYHVVVNGSEHFQLVKR
ncbi:MAG: T9SS type A sorting domain-containing protein, partial [Bacteroidota bacterium]